MVQLRTYLSVAGFGGIFVTATGYCMRLYIQNDIRNSDPYKEAMQCLHGHEKAMNLLGPPIIEKPVDISNNADNGSDEKICWFTIPLKGSSTNGKLYYEFSKLKNLNEKSMLNKVQLVIEKIPVEVITIKDNV